LNDLKGKYPDAETAVRDLKALKKKGKLSARNAKVLEQAIRESDVSIGRLEQFVNARVQSLSVEEVSPAVRQRAQVELTTAVASTMLSISQIQEILGQLSATATAAVSNVVNWFLTRIISVIGSIGPHLNVEHWTVGVQGGFPWGINFQISVTFKP
jgi:hypothetical protein